MYWVAFAKNSDSVRLFLFTVLGGPYNVLLLLADRQQDPRRICDEDKPCIFPRKFIHFHRHTFAEIGDGHQDVIVRAQIIVNDLQRVFQIFWYNLFVIALNL